MGATGAVESQAAWSAFRRQAEPGLAAFRHSHDDPETAQRVRLARLLAAARDTRFGQAHDFASIDSYEAYVERVPVADWQGMQRWIDAATRLDGDVLSKGRPLFFEPTSGSASQRKLIPYTQDLLAEFQRAIIAWLALLYDDCPEIADGRSYWALSPPLPAAAAAPNGIAVGGADDAAYLAGSAAVPLLATVLNPARLSADPDRWRMQTLVAMIEAYDLRMFSVWSPVFLVALLQPLLQSESTLDKLGEHLGRETFARVEQSVEKGNFARLWPDLAVISCWMDGPSERFVPLLREWFPDTGFSPKGLLATEGVISISRGLCGDCPLALDSHFLEFVDTAGNCILTNGLVEGTRYQPLLTTGGGLYRYALGDVIEYTGQQDGLHCARFIGRSDMRSDIVGEKLDEALVTNAWAALGCPDINAALVPLIRDDVSEYVLLLDRIAAGEAAVLARRLERRLIESHHYALARKLGQLAAVNAVVVSDVNELLQRAWQATGRRTGDLKPARLIVSTSFAREIMKHAS